MSEKDNVGNYLKSEEHKEKMKEAHRKASELKEKFKEPKRVRPRISDEEAQKRIDQQRDMIHNENMQPPPPPEFVDEFGKPIFENRSDIQLNVGMPQRFKGSRAGVPIKQSSLEQVTMPRRFTGERAGLKPEYQPSAPPTPREMYEMNKTQAPPQMSLPQPPPMTMQQMNDNDREFSHTTDLTFRDLSTEEYREYMYNNGGVLRILQPWKLAISRSGNHRVATKDGFSYIIVPGWIAIRVKKKVGAPAFTF